MPAASFGSISGSDGGHDGKGYRIYGDAGTEKQLYQTVPVKDGHTGDSYVFGAWAKAEAIPEQSLYHTAEKRSFAVGIRFVKSDGTYEERTYSFEAKSAGWQYLSGTVTAPCDYVSIRYEVLYDRQKNTAVFDDLTLYRERFGEVLTYDAEGRVITRTDASGLTTAYTYVWPHKPQVSTIRYPDGTYTIYTYDDTNGKPLQVYDASGKMLVYNYDWNNNPVSVTVYSGNSIAYEALVSGADTYTGSYVSQTADPFGNLTSYTYNQTKGRRSRCVSTTSCTCTRRTCRGTSRGSWIPRERSS